MNTVRTLIVVDVLAVNGLSFVSHCLIFAWISTFKKSKPWIWQGIVLENTQMNTNCSELEKLSSCAVIVSVTLYQYYCWISVRHFGYCIHRLRPKQNVSSIACTIKTDVTDNLSYRTINVHIYCVTSVY